MTTRLTVAQALVRFLAAQYTERDGVRQRLISATWGIFGHGNVAGLGQALVEYADDMPYHQGRNEQSMVHAAVGYARQSNRLSTHAVTTSIGPGATNLVTGAALATINHLPVLLLPGDIFATRVADPVLQQLEVPYAGDISVNDCLRPVSKYFDRVTRPEALIPAALQAMRVLTDPVETGAVTLALPQDVQAEAYDWPEEFFAERTWVVRRPGADPTELAEAIALIRSAHRPLVVAGGGVHHSRAEDALAEFAAATGFPVASTQAGKGSLRHDHPQDVGGVGHTGTATANELARQADLVIGVGTRYTDFTTASGTLFADENVRFLNLNIAPYDGHKLAGQPLVADARSGLQELTEALQLHAHRVPGGYIDEYTLDKERWEQRVDACFEADEPDIRPTQPQVLGALDALVDESDVIINAAGSLPGDLHKLWRARSRDQYHLEYGYSCMGYEIPAAIGVKMAAPDRNVWALVGDGTYLMMPTEIVTAVQEGIAIKMLLIQNHGYASIGGLSETVGGERFGTAYRYQSEDGTYTGAPLPVDLAANAASLGMRVLRAKTVRDLRAALEEARAADTPTCVYVETQTADTVSGAPPAQAWWDVPVAETATRPSAVKARELYERHVSTRRRHL
ncbi:MULTISPECIES: 3D-(3,5/4)-trihydroxycyclohexane-1,2-dione acylhydrolase (decyclizing) [unclassified Streptomyces]|jgi:3D-(3,5/4)-trihydroxycyclohexane-1,2-dione acylhydrolase (decyclizing)|uniref:3D-(3,5/4)-trihydroxycyclohexane-1,2-dione acylhydrolase (decyclizing) n=1 Tax=unclassified Streptomyces TaxID=2593676 RepID=UPI000F4FA6AB|nr:MULTISPECIES: 3D-(3,5/4)-trihydroxycyclohexane-1,2-dione acylhydrolase (decyclizing) [unclassified Streptomyces]MDH6450321.1 3D-(3,5/4)-trihydroxycyclohexane-1,2-dione acylhydrolase (decyclizing) [Streptomyces sp. SAI-119]MDH6499136.1 3D-(3,5/4)-trihydroxycyclohexane-1,2-dione acylhydrolase (decyclizing) [Streptomyces sp. SAI-149]QUC62109.1 3D-(3,5/4)-trihydroxycyclohexane-1,2-dione acylhydrolase (decyclizing) [Streptomyces sp. A2-16]